MEKIKVIIPGATGMIGESVLDQCLKNDFVEKILVINRKPSGVQHPKLSEIILANYSEASTIKESFKGYDACLFCVGVSSLGMKEESFTRLTYNLTIDFAKVLAEVNPAMTFSYISGSGTDSTEKGKVMWARVKGKTENDLMKLPFKMVYNFRPGLLIPYLKIKPNQTYQSIKYFKWLMVLLRPIFPNSILRLSDFANAMINSVLISYDKSIIETKEIKRLSRVLNR